MMVIPCKAVLLNRLYAWMLIGGVALATVLFLTIDIYLGYLYTIMMTLFFAATVYIFYQNRYELMSVTADGEQLYFSFYNKSFYKRRDIKVLKSEVVMKTEGDQRVFYINGKKEALVRKKAVMAADWDALGSLGG